MYYNEWSLERIQIPEIKSPLGRSWDQPEVSKILTCDGMALMNARTFNALHNYVSTMPTDLYVGKMWRRGHQLVWCDYHPRIGYVQVRTLPIFITPFFDP